MQLKNGPKEFPGHSVLGPCAHTAKGLCSISDQGNKIPQALWYCQKKTKWTKGLNGPSTKDRWQISYLQRGSTSYAIRETQIKTTYTPTRMTQIQKLTKPSAGGHGKECRTHSLLIRVCNGAATWKLACSFLQS